ncbi:MAG: beta-galactosidase, partial [Muribaculaceae bacterium]|nr:beta-galactosidase [Muribaculaceae bacterium]
MHRLNMLSFLILLLGLLNCAPAEAGKVPFNDGWLFSLKADSTAVNLGYDDKDWQTVTLPHDWSIRQEFDQRAPAGNDGGYLPAGCGWYRKTLNITPDDLDKEHGLYFEGVYMNSEVYVNGHLAGGHPYGYSSFYVDITPYLHPGNNVIAVKADNSLQKNCRWYSGSGIYRNVHLVKKNKINVPLYGIKVVTPDLHTAIVT